MKKKQSDLAARVRRLQAQVEGLNAEVTLWRTRYFELVAGGGRHQKAGDAENDILSGIRKSLEAADQKHWKKGGTPLEKFIRELPRGRLARELEVELLGQSGKNLREHLNRRGITEANLPTELEAWRKSQRGHRPNR